MQINLELNEKIEKIFLECINKHQSDFEKEVVFHDYLITHIDSADSELNDHNLSPRFDCYTVIGSLLEGKCVCSGISRAMKLLCDSAGIDNLAITGIGRINGMTKEHAWNMVKLGGYYHHVDITWDKRFLSDKKMISHAYLNLDDKTMAVDHDWDKTNYLVCFEAPYV